MKNVGWGDDVLMVSVGFECIQKLGYDLWMVFEWKFYRELAKIPSFEEMDFWPLMEFFQIAQCVIGCLRLLNGVFYVENDPLFIEKHEGSMLVRIDQMEF